MSSRHRVLAELLVLMYIALVAALAHASGIYYMLFPELGALSYGVLTRPEGRWSHVPGKLVATPALTAIAGTLITRSLPYGFTAVLLCVASAIAIMSLLRSPIVPAISAGLLPLVLGIKSWWYPVGILPGTLCLAALSIPWRHFHRATGDQQVRPQDQGPYRAESLSVMLVYRLLWVLAFVVLATGLGEWTGERFILFPPLVVITYEMLVHPNGCRELAVPMLRLPIVCLLAASGGLLCHHVLGVGPWAAVCSMVTGMVILRVSALHFSPILAIALLPQVMIHPTAAYPLTVLFGTLLLSGWFLLYRRIVPQAKPTSS